MLTKEQILAALDLKTESVDVPEWGGAVKVRQMSGIERDAFSEGLRGPDGKISTENYAIRLLVACMVDDDGKQLFTADDLQALGAKSSVVINRVFKAADALNSFGGAAIEEAQKN